MGRLKGQAQGLRPSGFKLWVKLDSTFTVPPREPQLPAPLQHLQVVAVRVELDFETRFSLHRRKD
jgi:hypothetical protein